MISTYRDNNIVPISVSRGVPTWATVGFDMKEVAPRWNMLKMPDKLYTAEYNKLLDRVDLVKFVKDLEISGKGKDVVLLCWESSNDFCHRHLLAERLNKEFDLEIKEFEVNMSEVTDD